MICEFSGRGKGNINKSPTCDQPLHLEVRHRLKNPCPRPIFSKSQNSMYSTLKLPMRSATTPAMGGMMIATMGVTADMMAASSTLMPSSRMWMVR